tara:strand:- start:131 stop:1690 length:1560 start_codon:yes stop_codon:yes gene_type:complete
MKKLKFLLTVLLLFQIKNLHSQEIDECVMLAEKLASNATKYKLDEPYGAYSQSILDTAIGNQWERFYGGLFFEQDFSEPFNDYYDRSYIRNKKGNIFIEAAAPNLFNDSIDSNDLTGAELISINGEQIKDLTDFEIQTNILNIIANKGSIEIVTRKKNEEEKLYKFSLTDFLQVGIPVPLEVLSILDINSLESTFTSRYIERFYWRQIGLETIGKEIKEILLKDSDSWIQSSSFYCDFSPNELIDLRIFIPNIRLENTISEEIISEKIRFSYQFESNDGGDNGWAYWEKVSEKIGTLKTKFNYRSFPFDSQSLNFIFQVIDYPVNVVPFVPFDNSIERAFNKLELDDWKKVSYDHHTAISLNTDDFTNETIQTKISFNFERNYLYYIIKIYLPILIVLLVSLSVLLINPIQLESRLTVSVVCFLALITYTYIVDRDVPRLSYLTIMDNLILLSYFFAAIPTFQSIYVNRIALEDMDRAETLNNHSKIMIPCLYIFSALLIVAMIVSYSPNTIAALKFTT